MTNSLGQLLTAKLQEKGIFKSDYATISKAVYESLHEIDNQIDKGECFTMPNGNEYAKTTAAIFRPAYNKHLLDKPESY